MRDRILLVSIPKAGTYLMSQALTELGYSPTHMHIGENAYSQYDPRRLQEGRDHPSRFRIKADWQEAPNNIDSHHFAASHLAFDNRKLRAMRGGRVLFLKREPRGVRGLLYAMGTHATELIDYWSPEAERVFKDIFGDLDARLGYPAGATSSWPTRSAGR